MTGEGMTKMFESDSRSNQVQTADLTPRAPLRMSGWGSKVSSDRPARRGNQKYRCSSRSLNCSPGRAGDWAAWPLVLGCSAPSAAACRHTSSLGRDWGPGSRALSPGSQCIRVQRMLVSSKVRELWTLNSRSWLDPSPCPRRMEHAAVM